MLFPIALFSVLALVSAQQIGINTPEVHPPLLWQECTTSGGCTSVNGSVVLDANYRWTHNVRPKLMSYVIYALDSNVVFYLSG